MGADDSTTPKGSYFHLSMDDGFFQLPSFLSKSSSGRSHTPPRAQTPTRFGVSLSKSASRRNSIPTDFPISPSTTTPNWTSSSPADFPSSPLGGTPNRRSTTPTSLSKSAGRQSTNPNSLSKSASRRSNSAGTSTDFAASLSKSTSRRSTTPIIYSQSTVRRKPQPIEKKLECTLEELCHGCNKKIKITRDVISDIGFVAFFPKSSPSFLSGQHSALRRLAIASFGNICSGRICNLCFSYILNWALNFIDEWHPFLNESFPAKTQRKEFVQLWFMPLNLQDFLCVSSSLTWARKATNLTPHLTGNPLWTYTWGH